VSDCLGGENDVSTVKRGDGIKKFEKHWSRHRMQLWWTCLTNAILQKVQPNKALYSGQLKMQNAGNFSVVQI